MLKSWDCLSVSWHVVALDPVGVTVAQAQGFFLAGNINDTFDFGEGSVFYMSVVITKTTNYVLWDIMHSFLHAQ